MHRKGFSFMDVPTIVLAFLVFSIVATVVLGILIFIPGSSNTLKAKIGSSHNDAALGALLRYEYNGKDVAFIINEGVRKNDMDNIKKSVYDFFGGYSDSWRMKISVKQKEGELYYISKYMITDLQAGESTYDYLFSDFDENYPGLSEPAYAYIPGDIRIDFALMDRKTGGST